MLRQEAVSNTQVVEIFNSGLQGVLNTINIGVVLLTGGGEVVVANKAAETIIESKDWLRVVDGRLRCRPEENPELETRIRLAANNSLEPPECFLHLSGSGKNDALVFAFTPHSSINLNHRDTTTGVVCIIVDPNGDNSADVNLLKRLYSLTDAEASIAAYLANGFDYTEIAEQRNVTVSTVRSYTKSIFKKLCVNNRAGVVRKVYAATIPLSLVH